MHLQGSPRQIDVIYILQQKRMSKVTTMFLQYFDPLRKVKQDMHMVTWNTLKKQVIRPQVSPLDQLPTI